MPLNRISIRTLAALVHLLGFFLGVLPGLLLWYLSYDRDSWLMRHGRAVAKFQAAMLALYIGLLSLYVRCDITTAEISALAHGSIAPLVERPEAVVIALLCVCAFVFCWLVSLTLSARSAIAAARNGDPAYPAMPLGASP